jgi:hypothetical protein
MSCFYEYKFDKKDKIWLSIMILVIVAEIIFLMTGCSTTVVHDRLIIRDTTYIVQPPVIIDSGKAQIVYDSLVRFIRRNRKDTNDTIIDIRYLPGTHEIFWKIKPDSVKIYVRDTTFKTETTVTQAPSMFGEIYILIIIIAGFLILIAISIFGVLRK